MSWIMPEIVVQKIISFGIKELRGNRAAFDDIFYQFTQDELAQDYGQTYLDQIWNWFSTTKIPVVKAWSFNSQQIPSISVHLANETEDESKSAIGDIGEIIDDQDEVGTAVFTAMVDIGIHANKAGDHVLWLYYIVSYILFRHKLMAERFGIKLHTYSASDYNKDSNKMTENIWTRWIRFRCTTQNFWNTSRGDEALIDSVNLDPAVNLPEAVSLSVSHDVDPTSVDITANQGLMASRIFDVDDEEDTDI